MVDVIHDCTQTLELATVKFIALKIHKIWAKTRVIISFSEI